MLQWIKVFYSNQAVLDNRSMKFRFIVPLFFVLVLFISVPNFIGFFKQDARVYLSKINGFSDDFYEMLKENDCEINEVITCKNNSKHKWEGNEVTFYFFYDLPTEGGKNEVYFISEGALIVGSDGKKITSGIYDNFGVYNFSDIAQKVEKNQISKDDLSLLFVRNLSLSMTEWNLVLTYMGMFINYLIYTLVLAFLFKFIGGKKEKNRISYKQSTVMMINLMLAPAMVCAAIGMFSPATAAMILPFAFVIRIIVLYYGVMRGKLKLSHPEVVS